MTVTDHNDYLTDLDPNSSNTTNRNSTTGQPYLEPIYTHMPSLRKEMYKELRDKHPELEGKDKVERDGLKFKITDVSMKGVVTIEFSEPVLLVQDQISKSFDRRQLVSSDDLTHETIKVLLCSSPDCANLDTKATETKFWVEI